MKRALITSAICIAVLSSLSSGSQPAGAPVTPLTKAHAHNDYRHVRPLHDALIEDSLERAARAVGAVPRVRAWSIRVRALRWLLSGGRAPRRSAG